MQQYGFEGKWPKVSEELEKAEYSENELIFNLGSGEGYKIYDVLKKK